MAKRASTLKKIVAFLFVIGIGALGYSGWKWLGEVKLLEVQVHGLVHATNEDIRELIAVDTGAVMFDIDPQILEDRIRRHPWIMEAYVSRLPTGLLDIRVVERHPVAQTLDSSGELGYYLDRNGFKMPVSAVDWYAVPIISGDLEKYNPVMQATDPSLRELLMVLPELNTQSDAILSELRRIDSGFEIRTTPAGEHASIPILIGDSDFAFKFRLLETFWETEVLRHQDVEFASIDLRFEGQIVTKQERRPPVKDIRNQEMK